MTENIVVECSQVNCLFNAVSRYAIDSEDFAPLLRKIAVHYVLLDFPYFSSLIDFPTTLAAADSNARMAWYTEHMLQNDTWVSNVVEGEALARALNIRLQYACDTDSLHVDTNGPASDIVVSIRFDRARRHFDLILKPTDTQERRDIVHLRIDEHAATLGFQ